MSSPLDVRLLSGTMAKIVLVMLFEHGGMTIDELSYRTGIRDLKTLRLACKDLTRSDTGLLVSQTMSHGREVWSRGDKLLPLMRDAYFQIPERGNPPTCIDAEVIQNGGIPRSDDENGLFLLPERGNPPTCTGSINQIDRLIEDDKEEPAPEKFPTLAKILEGLNILRGMKVGGHYDANMLWLAPDASSIPEKTPAKLALAWVVKTYSDRARLVNPVGQIITRLRSGSSRSLPENWQERLPTEYLRAIDMVLRVVDDLPANEPPEPLPPPNDYLLDLPPAQAAPAAPERPVIYQLYESEIGPITAMTADYLRDAEKSYPEAWITDAFALAVKNNARKWSYIAAILDGWQRNGRDWTPQTGQSKRTKNHLPAGKGKQTTSEVQAELEAWLKRQGVTNGNTT
jgi:DnaD/phage-associated family protein